MGDRRGFRQKHTMPEVNSLQKKNLQKIAEELSADKRLRFDRGEIEQLLIMFTTLTSGNKKALIERTQFRDVLHDSFKVFDLNGDGYISREEMFQLLKNCLVKQPAEEDPEEGIKELVDITLKKMDLDHDGLLSLEDFAESVKQEELLLEAFGKCLPNDDRVRTFEHAVLKTD